jgi:chromosome segregation ATPase
MNTKLISGLTTGVILGFFIVAISELAPPASGHRGPSWKEFNQLLNRFNGLEKSYNTELNTRRRAQSRADHLQNQLNSLNHRMKLGQNTLKVRDDQMKQKDAQILELQKRMGAQMQAKNRGVAQLREKVSSVSNLLSAAKAKANRLQSQLNNANNQAGDLRGKVKQFTGQISNLHGQVNQLNGKVNSLKGKLRGKESKIAQQEMGLKIIRARFHQVSKDHKKKMEEASSLRAQKDNLARQVANLHREIQKRQSRVQF